MRQRSSHKAQAMPVVDETIRPSALINRLLGETLLGMTQ